MCRAASRPLSTRFPETSRSALLGTGLVRRLVVCRRRSKRAQTLLVESVQQLTFGVEIDQTTEPRVARVRAARWYSESSGSILTKLTPDALSDELYAIDDVYRLPEDYEICVSFMLHGLELISVSLPPTFATALEVANDFWTRENSLRDAEMLKQAEHEVWLALRSADDRKVESAGRALMFVLSEEPSDPEVLEYLGWYVDFLIGASASEDDIRCLMTRHFPAADLSAK